MFLGEKIRQEKTLDKSWINKNQRTEAEADGKYPTKFEGIKMKTYDSEGRFPSSTKPRLYFNLPTGVSGTLIPLGSNSKSNPIYCILTF